MSAYTIALANGQHPPFPMSFLCSAANDCGYGGLYETPGIPPLETTEKHHLRQYATWNMAWNGIVFPVVLMFEQPEALAYTRALFREPQHARLLIKSYNVNKLLRQFSQYQIFYLQMKSSEFNNISEENPKCCIQIARGMRRSQCSLAHTHTHTMYSICRYIWQIRFAQNVSASTQNGCQRRKLFPAFRIHTHLPSNVCLGTWASSAALHWWPTTYPCVMQPMKESFWQWQIRTSYSYKTKSASHCIHLLSFCSADAKVARFCLALNEFARN